MPVSGKTSKTSYLTLDKTVKRIFSYTVRYSNAYKHQSRKTQMQNVLYIILKTAMNLPREPSDKQRSGDATD